MIGRRQELNLQFLQIVDALLLAAAFWVAHFVRYAGFLWGFFDGSIESFETFQWILVVLVPFGPLALENYGFYEHPSRKTLGKTLSQFGRSAIVVGVIIALCGYFLKKDVASRAVMPIFAVLATIALLVRERVSIARYRHRVKTGLLRERVILVGTAVDIFAFRNAFTPDQVMELEVVQEIDLQKESVETLVTALHEHSVGRVLFVGGHSEMGRLNEYIGACETEGVEAWLSADFIRTSIARPDFDAFGSRPMLVFRAAPSVSWALMAKHLTDRLVAFVLLICFSWLFAIIACAIRFTSPGPIVFRQARGGKNGRSFTIYKFRTMVTDAEMQRDELQRMNQMQGPVFKIARDPRITRIGRFLRKTSLDEIPQLWNVLKGDMSLVGPRPLPMYEVEKFETTAQRRRLAMKPGITCLWQISGRSNITSFDRWVALDLEYIDNWSLWLDVKILLRTCPVVLFGFGAK
jgi:exopolysaccharide biosynthesis polyprenyl glycosylphosphotransferase